MVVDLLGDELEQTDTHHKPTPTQDLLLLDDLDVQHEQLPPAMQPIANSQPLDNNTETTAEDADDFGDFIQGTLRDLDSTSLAFQNTNSGPADKPSGSNVALPLLPLPRSSSLGIRIAATSAPTSTTLPTPATTNTKAITKAHQNNAPPDSSTEQTGSIVTGEQILGWLSTVNTPNGNTPGADRLFENKHVGEAWESAVGLMGGSHLEMHIREIASRLCSVIPETPAFGTTALLDSAPEETTESLENWAGMLDSLDSTPTGGPQLLRRTQDTRSDQTQLQRILNAVWSRGDGEALGEGVSGDGDSDMTQAYLRLVELSKNQAEQEN